MNKESHTCFSPWVLFSYRWQRKVTGRTANYVKLFTCVISHHGKWYWKESVHAGAERFLKPPTFGIIASTTQNVTSYQPISAAPENQGYIQTASCACVYPIHLCWSNADNKSVTCHFYVKVLWLVPKATERCTRSQKSFIYCSVLRSELLQGRISPLPISPTSHNLVVWKKTVFASKIGSSDVKFVSVGKSVKFEVLLSCLCFLIIKSIAYSDGVRIHL